MKKARVLAYAAAIACAALALAGCSDTGSPPSGGDPGPVSFTVDFDSQGGGNVASAKVLSGETVDEPLNLTNAANEDLIFSGWYTEAACATRWDFEDPVSKDMKLYAKWNAANTLSFAAISGGAAWEVGAGTGALDADLYFPSYYKGIPVTSIADWAFNGNSSLVSVVLPSGLKRVGYCTFCDCSLSSVTLPPGIEELAGFAFDGTEIREINIPASLTTISAFALSDCTEMTRITVDEENEYFSVVDGVLFSKDKTMLVTYPAGKPETSYSVPAGVTGIGTCAFGSSPLVTVTFPTSLTYIGSHAFNCSVNLHTVILPASVTTLDTRAFSLCFVSTPGTIFIPNTVTSVGFCAFWDSSNLSIRCQAASKPSGWDSSWNYSNLPVTWGCSN